MFDISQRLLYYKKKEVQVAILESSKNKEVGVKFGENGFGKRPDILVYETDLLEFVKKGATSFHLSEERWNNPLELTTEMRKEDLDNLRIGWDLVLDVDCPFWYYSKLTTYLFIKALKKHGVESISCKFSGNKGFHIGVPFEAFPEIINNIPVKNWFPEGPKKIALYLLDYISNNFIEVNEEGEIIFDKVHKTTKEDISKITGKTIQELSVKKCPLCKKKVENSSFKKIEFVCPNCNIQIRKDQDSKIMICPKCNILMSKFESSDKGCKQCGAKEPPKEFFDSLSIINVDTVLISSRHMYRSPYSMHEKSGLVSLPIPIGKILTFEKETARPEKINTKENPIFLDVSKVKRKEAENLLISAFDFGKEDIHYKNIINDENKSKEKKQAFENLDYAVPPELFPPCILKILEGIPDGRKRSLFVLTNFLTSLNWSYENIELILLEWNKKNKETLREGIIKGQLRYHRQKNKKILPPNCREYYQDFGVCFPDLLCEKIKNPVQYSKRKAFALNKTVKKRAKLTDEQKEARRQYREKLKKKQQK